MFTILLFACTILIWAWGNYRMSDIKFYYYYYCYYILNWNVTISAWALKRGFLTARVSRPDVYRSANSILRLAVEARLCLCSSPPGYTVHKGNKAIRDDISSLATTYMCHQNACFHHNACLTLWRWPISQWWRIHKLIIESRSGSS